MHSQTRPIDHFIRVLLEEIERTAPHSGDEPFTVAEIYQSLIPYRTHRDRLGVEMNGDYEDTLLRLLAGEGDFLILESQAARDRIRKELSQSNPNTGIYREFAAVGVRLNPDRVAASSPPSGAPAGEEAPRERESAGPRAPSRAPDPAPTPNVAREPAAITTSAPVGPPSGECPDSGEALPQRDSLRVRPHCGTEILLAPCRK
jgi:hypothetical protein